MEIENEVLPRKRTRLLSYRFALSRIFSRSVTGKYEKQIMGSERSLRRFLTPALLLISPFLFMGTGPFLHSPHEPQPQAVKFKTVSGSGIPSAKAPFTIALGKRTLTGALVAHGVPQSVITQIIKTLRSHLNLRQLQPEDTLQLYYNSDGILIKMVYRKSPLEIFDVYRQKHGWVSYKRDMVIEKRVTLITGTLENTLFGSIEKLGESPRLVLDFAEIFAWDFDFAVDSQPGDLFCILVEKLYVKDQFVDYGRILAAGYESKGTVHTAIYFQEKERGDYYTPSGESLRRAFLKSPLNFSRISSGYNRTRPHPVLGGMRPHLAVDYAAPTGTPVWAVADGVVKFAGWKKGYGKTVILRHMANYQTIYSHLSRFGKEIRRGVKVQQRQVIGHVGSTGVATGPHLDYRVIKDGESVNPLEEKFLPGKSISQSSRPSFISKRDSYLQQIRNGLKSKASFPASKHIIESFPIN